MASITTKILWQHFKTTVPHIPIELVFELDEQTLKIFSELKLVSVQSRLNTIFD